MEGKTAEDHFPNDEDNERIYSLLLQNDTHKKRHIITSGKSFSSYEKKISSHKPHNKSFLLEHKEKQKAAENELVELLKEKKSLQESINDFENGMDIEKEKCRIDAITEILDPYRVSFNLKLKVVKIDPEDYQIGINFIFNQKLCDKTIYFTINYNRNAIIDFNASSFCSKDEELSYKDWFRKNNNNVAGLLHRLRNELLEKMNS